MGFMSSDASIFLNTSSTANIPNRLDKRFHAIFESRPEIWKNKRILDLGSHDGRWSYAALKMGAAHVTGVEGRPHLVNNANANMEKLSIDRDKYEFVRDDIFRYLETTNEMFDLVLCLGIFYHTYNHLHLVSLMNKVRPDFIILDTMVNTRRDMACKIKKDRVRSEAAAIRDTTTTIDGYKYVAIPSVRFLRSMMQDIGFGFQRVDWKPLIKANPVGLPDYILHRRITAICERGKD